MYVSCMYLVCMYVCIYVCLYVCITMIFPYLLAKSPNVFIQHLRPRYANAIATVVGCASSAILSWQRLGCYVAWKAGSTCSNMWYTMQMKTNKQIRHVSIKHTVYICNQYVYYIYNIMYIIYNIIQLDVCVNIETKWPLIGGVEVPLSG